jgi:glucan biosynthesis protein C
MSSQYRVPLIRICEANYHRTQDETNTGKQVQAGQEGSEEQKRLYYLDWLRVLAVLGVFYAHAISIFDMLYWHMNDSRGISLVIFGTEWGMALFFLLAGASAWFSLGSRTSRQFIAERFMRLVVPFAFGVVLLSPPQAYLLEVGLSRYHGSFLQFYTSFFAHVQLSLNPQILAAYGFHLWFLAFLFLYSVLALTFFFYVRRPSGQRAIARLAVVCERPGGIYLFLLPLAVIQVALQPAFPVYQGWTSFLSWFVYFVYGYLFLSSARLNRAIRQQAWIAFCIGAISLITLLATTYGHGFLSLWVETPSYSIRYELYQLLLSITAWSWMIFVVYFGMRFLNVSNKLIQYGDEAVLPFYVLHYGVIVALAYLFLPWHVDLVVKFLMVSTLSLAVTLALYEGLIRRYNISRRMFGMKLKKREGRTTKKQYEGRISSSQRS